MTTDYRPTARIVTAEVADKHGVSVDRLLSYHGMQSLRAARAELARRLQRECQIGYIAIGKYMRRSESVIRGYIHPHRHARTLSKIRNVAKKQASRK